MNPNIFYWIVFFIIILMHAACKGKNETPDKKLIAGMSLKRGALISCSPGEQKFGDVDFSVNASAEIKKDFNLGVQLLHSFEYDEAEKVFAGILDKAPDCAMAYWGVAMSNFHPLWTPPSEAELKKGAAALAIAKELEKSKREEDYLAAIASFYGNWENDDHRTRCLRFEKSMESLAATYRDDKEATILYALALNAAVDPTDKTYSKQKKAGSLLKELYPGQPNHPGIVHYIIHTYDSPELAEEALPAARKYASIAPSSAHALHMPSHIFTRLGLWDEGIESNLASVSSAKCYAESAGLKGHWDEELHGLDYLVYGYLQKGDHEKAKEQLVYLNSIKEVSPVNFKVAYAYAAIPSRYLLENRLWKEAAELNMNNPVVVSWEKFPWQKAILHFTRCLGSVHSGKIEAAKTELTEMKKIHEALLNEKNSYQAAQVSIQVKTAEAWIELKSGNKSEAVRLMTEAAEMEDRTGKHPVTPGEVLPARELLGDLFMEVNEPAKAFEAYEQNLKKHPNRLNGIRGAKQAAEKMGNKKNMELYAAIMQKAEGK